MLTITCRIQFRDGATITSRASAETPYDDVVINYTGSTALIPDRPEKCAVMVMRYWMQKAASRLGAEFIEEYKGEFQANE